MLPRGLNVARRPGAVIKRRTRMVRGAGRGTFPAEVPPFFFSPGGSEPIFWPSGYFATWRMRQRGAAWFGVQRRVATSTRRFFSLRRILLLEPKLNSTQSTREKYNEFRCHLIYSSIRVTDCSSWKFLWDTLRSGFDIGIFLKSSTIALLYFLLNEKAL